MRAKGNKQLQNKNINFPDNSKGIFLINVNLLLYLLAMYSGDYIVWTISVTISLLLLISFAAALASYNCLTCTQFLTKDVVVKGDVTELVLECQNKLPFFVIYAMVLYKTPTNYIEKLIGVTSFTIMPKQSFMLKIRINTQVKGIYDVGFCEMRITDFLGFFMFKPVIKIKKSTANNISMENGLSLVVTPQIFPVNTLDFSKIHDALEDRSAVTGSNELPVISDIRTYQYGDPLKRINWKATAKHRKVFINNFERSYSTNVGLYIGCLAVKDRISRIITEDYACDCGASLVNYFLKNNVSVTLICDGIDAVYSLNSQEHYYQNTYLMLFAKNNIISTPQSINELRAKISKVGRLDYLFMIIEEITDPLLEFFKDINELGTAVSVLLINDNNPAEIEKAGWLQREKGIPIHVIPQGSRFADVIGR